MQFLYADGTDAHFMDEESYEQIALPETSMAEPLKWVKPNESVDMLYIDGEPADIQLTASRRARGHAHGARRPRRHRLRRRQQARHAGDGRDRERPAVREHRGPDQGRHALGLVHVARVARLKTPHRPIRIPMGIRPPAWRSRSRCAAVLALVGSRNVFWADYFVEAWPAYFGAAHRRVDDVPAPDARLQRLRDADRRADRAARRRAWTGRFRLRRSPALLVLAGLAVALHARASGRTRCWRSCSSPARRSPTSRSTRAIRRTCSPPPRRPPACSPPCAAARRSPPPCSTVAVARQADRRARAAARRARAAQAEAARPRGAGRRPRCSSTAACSSCAPADAHDRRSPPARYFHPWQVWWPFGVPSDPAWAAAGHGDDHLARLAGADPAPADRRARAAAEPPLVAARRARPPARGRAGAASRCSRSSAACSTPGTSATTTCRWCSRSSRGRPRSAARR